VIAETARLITELGLKDQLSPGLGKATSSLSAANKASQVVSGGLKGLGGVMGGAGDAAQHLFGRIGQLSGALGIVGLGGGLIGVTALLKDSISEAKDFGGEVSKLTSVTGLTATKTSELAGVFHHFGIESNTALTIAGMAEKNLFKLGETADKAKIFQDKYGLSLVTSSGQLKDFNTLLLDSAKFFNDPLISAAQKAAAMAAIFGRNWQALLPVLKAGADGIASVEEEAKAMGLTLTSANLTALSKLKEATRSWTTALGGLKLQIGLALIPTLTNFTTKLTSFLTATDKAGVTGSQKIVTFLKDVIAWGGQAAAFIQHNIVPGIKLAIDNWNKIPPQVRSLLFKGFAGNATVSFLLGFNPVSIATSVAASIGTKIAASVAGGIFGAVSGRIAALIGSKAIPQLVQAVAPIPVLVVNQGFGGLPTGGAPVAGEVPAAAGGSLVAKLLKLGSAILAGALVIDFASGGLTGTPSGGNISPSSAAGILAGSLQKGVPWKELLATGQFTAGTLQDLANNAKLLSTLSYGQVSELGKMLDEFKGNRSVLDKVLIALSPLSQIGSLVRSERTDPRPKPLTAADLIKFLATTPVTGPTGRTSILEQSTNPRRGQDPFGESALGVFERTTPAILKTPEVLAQVRGHITELRDVTKFYLARGDTVAAGKTQTVIEKIEALIGVAKNPEDIKVRAEIKRMADDNSRHAASDRADAAALESSAREHTAQVRSLITSERTDAVETHTKLQNLVAGWSAIHGVVSGQTGILAGIRDKNWVNINNNYVQVASTISVDTLTRTFISEQWATSGYAPNSIR
jgi:hypothetical protein